MSDPERPKADQRERAKQIDYYADHYRELGDEYPFMQSCAIYLGIHKRYLRHLKAHRPVIREALERMKLKGFRDISNRALRGEASTNLAVFILAYSHGYKTQKVYTCQWLTDRVAKDEAARQARKDASKQHRVDHTFTKPVTVTGLSEKATDELKNAEEI